MASRRAPSVGELERGSVSPADSKWRMGRREVRELDFVRVLGIRSMDEYRLSGLGAVHWLLVVTRLRMSRPDADPCEAARIMDVAEHLLNVLFERGRSSEAQAYFDSILIGAVDRDPEYRTALSLFRERDVPPNWAASLNDPHTGWW